MKIVEKMARAHANYVHGGSYDYDADYSQDEKDDHCDGMIAAIAATGLTEAQLEGLANGTMVVVPIGSPVGLVISERARQVSKGYNARHDDMHDDGSIISADWGAAKRLAMATDHYAQMDDPMTYVKRLVQAATMIFAELDRVDRAMLAAKEG